MMVLQAIQIPPPPPGTWVIALSDGCAEQITRLAPSPSSHWPQAVRTAVEPGPTLWVRLPSHDDAQTLLQVCRAAHEVWVLDEERSTPTVALALELRTQSAPPSMGERRSVLHAPELGPVRLWTADGEASPHAPDVPPAATEDTRPLLASVAHALQTQAPQDWHGMSLQLQTQAQGLQRRVRLALLTLFVATIVGVVALQALSMAGWNIPMADLYAVYFMLVGSFYLWARQHHWNEHQLALRSLAQALDIKALWSEAALPHEPITTQFQLKHQDRLDWVCAALRPLQWPTSSAPSAARETGHPRTLQSTQATLQRWLPVERKLHVTQAAVNARKAAWLSGGVKACYGLSGLFTLLVVLQWPPDVAADTVVSTALGLLSSLGTLLLIFNGVLGYGQSAAMHQHLVAVLDRSLAALDMRLSPHEYDELLLDVGKECIQSAAERALL